MSVQRYRLTAIGWVGAALFVLPTPIAAWIYSPKSLSPGEAAFQQRLAEMGNVTAHQGPSAFVISMLATATLAGLVMLMVGRESYSH